MCAKQLLFCFAEDVLQPGSQRLDSDAYALQLKSICEIDRSRLVHLTDLEQITGSVLEISSKHPVDVPAAVDFDNMYIL